MTFREQRLEKRLAGPFALLCLLALAACGKQEAEQPAESLPQVPEIDTTGFLPVIRTQLDEAIAQLAKKPYDPDLNGKLGMMLAAYDQDAPAAALFARARRLDSGKFEWPYYLGYARYDLGQLEQAAAAMRTALELRPEHANARIKLAEFLLESGAHDQARKEFEAVVDAFPQRVEGHLGLGKLANLAGESQNAIEHLEAALRIESRIGEIHFAMAEAHRALGDQAAAQKHLAEFERYQGNRPNPRDPELLAIGAMNVGDLPHLSRGMAYMREGRVVDAARAFKQAIKINPTNVAALTGLMELHGRNRELSAAEKYFRRALAVNEANAELLGKWAAILRINRQPERSIETWRRAIEMDAFNADFKAGLGRALQDSGEVAAAEEQYRAALELNGAHREAVFNLAYLHAMRGENNAAVTLLRPLVRDTARASAPELQLLARVEAQTGEFERALDLLGRARSRLVDGNNPGLLRQVEADIEAVQAAKRRAGQ